MADFSATGQSPTGSNPSSQNPLPPNPWERQPLYSYYSSDPDILPPYPPRTWIKKEVPCGHEEGCEQTIQPGDPYITVASANGSCRFVSPHCFTPLEDVVGSHAWRQSLTCQDLLWLERQMSDGGAYTIHDPKGPEADPNFKSIAGCFICGDRLSEGEHAMRLTWTNCPSQTLLTHPLCSIR